MERKLLYRKRVESIRLEIAGVDDELLGSIYYEAEDRRFKDGGLELVLVALSAVLEALGREEGLGAAFLGSFEPVVPPSSTRLEEARAMFQDYRTRIAQWESVEIGERTTLTGVWIDRPDALGLLNDLATRCTGLSAEESSLRMVLTDRPDEGASGWDLMHQNGATHLGRWEQNLRERPGSVDPKESATLEFALEAARTALERRLAQS